MEPTKAVASTATLEAAAAYLESRTGLTDSEEEPEDVDNGHAEDDFENLPRSAA